jgi:hypothetical protein
VVECFCGCGRSVRFGRRSANAMGSMVALELERLEEMRAAVGPDARRTIGLSAVILEGRRIYVQLQARVHRGRGDPSFATPEVARWLHVAAYLGTEPKRKVHQGVEQRSQGD